jgi:hypothetical protein
MFSCKSPTIVVGFVLLLPLSVFALGAPPGPRVIDYAAARASAEKASAVNAGNIPVAATPDRVAVAREDYEVSTYQHRRSTFWWQYYSTIVIFGAVIVLIGFGVYLAWAQFRVSANVGVPTSIKLGRDGLEINSSFVGLLILFFSLGFFYLYLTNVYPISEVNVPHALASRAQ